MYFVFADDAKQNHPSRNRMGPLVAAGAILIEGDGLKDVESSIETLCRRSGFPVDDPKTSEFKWSPGRELWMRDNLTEANRERFFLSVIERLTEADVKMLRLTTSIARLQILQKMVRSSLPTKKMRRTYFSRGSTGYSEAAKRMQLSSTIDHLNRRMIFWRLDWKCGAKALVMFSSTGSP
jgi:hypothetical protein